VGELRRSMNRLDRATSLILVIAALWSGALVVLADVFGSTTTILHVQAGGGRYSTRTAGLTLVQENGLKVLIPISLPLVAVAVVTYGLRRRKKHGLSGAGGATWGVAIAVCALCLLAVLTVGPFMMPVAVLLVLACVRAPLRPVVHS